MARPEAPRFALVLWPDAYDPTVPSCIRLDGVPDAVARRAQLIAVEDEELTMPVVVFNPPRVAAEGEA